MKREYQKHRHSFCMFICPYFAVCRVELTDSPSDCCSLGECKSCGETTVVKTYIKVLCKCYLLGCTAGLKTDSAEAESSWVLTAASSCSVPHCHREQRLSLEPFSSLAPAEDTGKWARVLHPFHEMTQPHIFGGRMSLSPCKAPGAAVPPSVRRSASSQHCRGSSSGSKLCFPAFFTGVSQAWMFTPSGLHGKYLIQGTDAKIDRRIPSIFTSSFYLKSTSNNLVVKLLKYNAMYYFKIQCYVLQY